MTVYMKFLTNWMNFQVYPSISKFICTQEGTACSSSQQKHWVTEWVIINLQPSWLIQTPSQAREEGRGWSKEPEIPPSRELTEYGIYASQPACEGLSMDLVLNASFPSLGSSVHISMSSQCPELKDNGTTVKWLIDGKMCRPGRNCYMIPVRFCLSSFYSHINTSTRMKTIVSALIIMMSCRCQDLTQAWCVYSGYSQDN